MFLLQTTSTSMMRTPGLAPCLAAEQGPAHQDRACLSLCTLPETCCSLRHMFQGARVQRPPDASTWRVAPQGRGAPAASSQPQLTEGPRSGPTYLHCMYQARQMALLSRILSLHWSFRPLKFFHFGDTNFPLKGKKRGNSVVPLKIK